MGSTVTLWCTTILLGLGSVFMLLAAVGVVRLPDLFTRLQASTKSSTLGVACMLLAVAVYFGTLGVTTHALLVIVFFFLTMPVAAHMIARAAYFSGVPLWKSTVVDELQGRYDPRTHTLKSQPHLSEEAAKTTGPDEQATQP
jgi:multicomponent Na+:H+ antiporter subunit G